MNEFIEKLIGRLEKEEEYQLKKAEECEQKQAFEIISASKSRRKNAQCYDVAIQIVNQLAEEYSNLSENLTSWIPCSERLPEKRDWYLAVFQEVDTGFIGLPFIADYLMGVHTNYTTEDGWIIANCTDIEEERAEYYKKLKCIAWQPLPEPFKQIAE